MIFVERIAQFDRASRMRSAVREINFEVRTSVRPRPARRVRRPRFEIVIAIRLGFGREAAAIAPGTFCDSKDAHDFLDQIDVALQIEAVTRNAPRTLRRCSPLAFCKPKPLQEFLRRASGGTRHADQFVAVLVAQAKHPAAATGSLPAVAISAAGFAPAISRINSAARFDAAQDHSGIDAAFEAVAGVARQIESARRAANAGRTKNAGCFQQNIVVDSVTPVSSPPITPAMPTARSSSAMTRSSWPERVGFSIEREKFLAVAREADIDRAFQFVGVEGVESAGRSRASRNS